MKHAFVLFASIGTLLCSCADTTNNKMILGNWRGTEWLIDGRPSHLRASETRFTFDSTGKYTYEYAGNVETGKYKVENDMLFTTPKGEKEIMVKIRKLTADSLLFDMNRSGQSETLVLVRTTP